ncbi:MAG: bifunctional nuclease family protein [Bacteroidota bacterium]|nr:bifunctional nuclease family protein [Bacteroidota bacterium]MEC8662330.1 bifunctional nuclease family protein [Bacteroidota bacterium]
MKKIDLEILDIALSGSSSGAYALVLGEAKGKRKLPIVIGGAEAQSIAIELENMRPSRPLTHDLMKNTLSAFGMEVTEVLIHKMVEGIFYAQLTVTDGIREENIDSRSSDAVAVAVRFGCPIRCSQQVMDEAGVDLEGNEGEFVAEEKEAKPRPSKKKEVTVEELQKQLDEAIATENYELASELKKRIDDLKG